MNTVCRATTVQSESGRMSEYMAVTHLVDIDECRQFCDTIKPCYGFEFDSASDATHYGNCEIWIVPIVRIKFSSGNQYKCFNNTAAYSSPQSGSETVTAGFNVSNLNLKNLMANSAMLTNITTHVKTLVESSMAASLVTANVTIPTPDTWGSDLHVRLLFSSTQHHPATLHNAVRAAASGKNLGAFETALTDASPTLTAVITNYLATLNNQFKTAVPAVTWDFTTLTSLAEPAPNDSAGGGNTTTNLNSTGLISVITDLNSTGVINDVAVLNSTDLINATGGQRGLLQRLADPLNLQQPWTALLYMIGDIYVFFALHLIVHKWFEPSISRTVDLFQMQEDVAGATLMAIGTSLPELLSGLVGVFVPGAGDTGLGTVLGSLVFNMLMITGLCIIVVPEDVLCLSRVATIRDVTCQVVVIGVLCWAFSDHQVDVKNVAVFLGLYVLYILVCWKSKDVASAVGCDDKSEQGSKEEHAALAGGCDDESDHESNVSFGLEEGHGVDHKHAHDLHDATSLLSLPKKNAQSVLLFILSIPLVIFEAMCHITIPNSRSRFWTHRDKTGLLLCATMCTVWITLLVFFMMEWAVKAGELLGIEASIMGLTFCAAGTSVPDCMCSVIVAKQGRGKMAISNVFGSNVFDVLIAMAIPWALRYEVMGTQQLIKMEADGFAAATVILVLVIIFYVACVVIGKFRLPKQVGYIHVGLYGVFIIYVFVSNLAVFKANK